MALILSKTLPTGEAGNYWRIIEVNNHADRGSVATLQLYKSKTLRQADAQPLGLSYRFIFSLEEIQDMEGADENLLQGWRHAWYHPHYLAIKAAIASCVGKIDEQRTDNERAAANLLGAVDDL